MYKLFQIGQSLITLDSSSLDWQILVLLKNQNGSGLMCRAGIYKIMQMPSESNKLPATFQKALNVIIHLHVENVFSVIWQ